MFIKQTPKRKHTLTVSFNLDREAHKAYDATIHVIPIQLWWNMLQSKQVGHKSRSTDFSNNYTKKTQETQYKVCMKNAYVLSPNLPQTQSLFESEFKQ